MLVGFELTKITFKRENMRNKYVVSYLAIVMTFYMNGCSTVQDSSLGKATKKTFASDDPCSNNARNKGMLIGALAGVTAGYLIGDKKPAAAILAGAAGMVVGGAVGADMDKKRCELSKIAKQYDLQMDVANVDVSGAVVENSGGAASENLMGIAVNIGEKNGRGHFEVDSDQLTPTAQHYFAAIADAYNPQKFANKILDDKERAAYLETARLKKILLVGHTDDTGDTRYNVNLSERRARAVAKFLGEHGLPEDILYFQGAGESLPKADNRTEAGRAQNRRVELVEVTNEVNFQKYLQVRQPKHEYYRPVDTPLIVRKAGGPSVPPLKDANIATTNNPKNVAPSINLPGSGKAYKFGGHPLSADANVNLGRTIHDGLEFSFFSKAYADDAVVLASCERDRPRATGDVKSLKDGKAYATTEYLPGLYNTSWHDTLNGNLIMLNHVGVLSDSAAPSNSPELKIYADYNPQKNRNAKPNILTSPAVNTYRGSGGILYRVFAEGAGGVQCMDVVLPVQGGLEAKAGELLYNNNGTLYAAEYKPKMIR